MSMGEHESFQLRTFLSMSEECGDGFLDALALVYQFMHGSDEEADRAKRELWRRLQVHVPLIDNFRAAREQDPDNEEALRRALGAQVAEQHRRMDV